MRILVTRPRPDADALSERLTALGHGVVVDPLLRVQFIDFTVPPERPRQAVVITSRNALRALERHPETIDSLRSTPLFAVGAATASHARALGFADVRPGPGTAAQLARQIADTADPAGGPLLCLTGEVTAYDLPAALDPLGFTLETIVAYRTIAATQFSAETVNGLVSGGIDAVLLMSARTARTYTTLVSMHNQLENIRNIAHLCLSETISDELSPLHPLIIRTAARPSIEELLALAGPPATSLP